MIRRIPILLLLILAVIWGRSNQPSPLHGYETLPIYSNNSLIITRAWAGALPGLAADISVLQVFNIYNALVKNPSSMTLKDALSNRLQIAQKMDPYFLDTYRLAEGLLAYEAKKYREAIDLLAASQSYLHTYETLLVAAFIAYQYLHDSDRAMSLAQQAAAQPDAPAMAASFAARLIHEKHGCKLAIAFLQSRMHVMPITYQKTIQRKIKALREDLSCNM